MEQVQKEFQSLLKKSEDITAFQSIFNLLGWDQETYMPLGAIDVRSWQMAHLAQHIHKKKTSAHFKNQLAKLIDLKTGKTKAGLNVAQNAALREWRKDYMEAVKIPSHFVHTFSKASAKSVDAWTRARANNDFKTFEPHLDGLVKLVRKKAKILGYKDHPYDALINIYEPGMTAEKLHTLFSRLKKSLISILEEIQAKGPVDTSILQTTFPRTKQLALGNDLLKILDLDPKYSRLDESTHPFSTSMHPHDSRITTRIHEDNLLSNILSILHECGHAFYEMGLDLEYYGSPLSESVSLGIHESQSRWWETRIGRSYSFWEHFYPSLQKHFSDFKSIPLDQFYKAIHEVKPSLVRVEADEVTYCLHIILRFEIELALLDESLEVKDLPKAWNEKSEELLGIAPPTDALGCMQDIHWSMGELGYFPTYALGNLYASHFFETFEKEHSNYEERLRSGEVSFIKEWLRKNIHSKGRFFMPEDLAIEVTGKPLTEEAFIKHLTSKYL